MKDYNNNKTIEILRKNKIPIILKMTALSTLLFFVPLAETITKSLLNKADDEIIITIAFWLVRMFFAAPLIIGVFRGFYNIDGKKDCFALCCFMTLKGYFSSVAMGVFTLVFLVYELILLSFFKQLVFMLLGTNIFIKTVMIILAAIVLFLAVLRIIDALIKAYKSDVEKMCFRYFSSLGKSNFKKTIRSLFPCLSRLILLVFIFPAVYVLPFTFVRMSIRENKTDVV